MFGSRLRELAQPGLYTWLTFSLLPPRSWIQKAQSALPYVGTCLSHPTTPGPVLGRFPQCGGERNSPHRCPQLSLLFEGYLTLSLSHSLSISLSLSQSTPYGSTAEECVPPHLNDVVVDYLQRTPYLTSSPPSEMRLASFWVEVLKKRVGSEERWRQGEEVVGGTEGGGEGRGRWTDSERESSPEASR